MMLKVMIMIIIMIMIMGMMIGYFNDNDLDRHGLAISTAILMLKIQSIYNEHDNDLGSFD